MGTRTFIGACGFLCISCVPAPKAPQTDQECAPSQWDFLIGEDVNTLDQASLPKPSRIIRPRQAITMDYLVGRTNFVIDAAGRVEKIYCG